MRRYGKKGIKKYPKIEFSLALHSFVHYHASQKVFIQSPKGEDDEEN